MTNSDLHDVAQAFCQANQLDFHERVGEGAFKETFHIITSDGVDQALKVFKPRCSQQRTEREISAMVRCEHSGIARLHSVDVFQHEDVEYVVVAEEFLAGGTLQARVSSLGRIDAVNAYHLGRILMGAIQHIASHNLVHRDLKPENILFRDDRMSPVIVDFGLVRDLSDESLTQTWALQGPGTPYFAPPEQHRNDKSLIDWRSDQFALGVTISVVTLGFHPYADGEADEREAIELVAQHRGPTRRFSKEVSSMGLPVLSTMVAPWPVQRYRTPARLIEAWEEQEV